MSITVEVKFPDWVVIACALASTDVHVYESIKQSIVDAIENPKVSDSIDEVIKRYGSICANISDALTIHDPELMARGLFTAEWLMHNATDGDMVWELRNPVGEMEQAVFENYRNAVKMRRAQIHATHPAPRQTH